MNNYSEKRYFSMHENLSSVLAESAGRYTVVIPAGVYETGPVDVPSDTRLVLEEGAVLSFSDDFDAYPPVYTRWEGVDCWAMHPCFMINGASERKRKEVVGLYKNMEGKRLPGRSDPAHREGSCTSESGLQKPARRRRRKTLPVPQARTVSDLQFQRCEH